MTLCNGCGAQIDEAARFCRSCGKPFDASELTTRRLEPDIQYQSPTQIVNQSPTTPVYLSPVPVPAVPATNDLTPSPKPHAIPCWLQRSGAIVFCFCLCVLNGGLLDKVPQLDPAGGYRTSIPARCPLAPPHRPNRRRWEVSYEVSLKYPGPRIDERRNGRKECFIYYKGFNSKVTKWYPPSSNRRRK